MNNLYIMQQSTRSLDHCTVGTVNSALLKIGSDEYNSIIIVTRRGVGTGPGRDEHGLWGRGELNRYFLFA